MHDRVFGCDPFRCDLFHLEAEDPGHRGTALQFFQPLGVGGDRDRAVLLHARRLARLLFETEKKLRCVLGQLGHVSGRTELTNEPCCVPGRAASQLFALQQQHISDTNFRQVIGHRAADGTATHDHDLSPAGQLFGH